MMLGGGERAGSGVDTIVRGCRDYHWANPVMKEDSRKDTVTLSLGFKGKDTSDKTAQASGKTAQASGNNKRAEKRLKIEKEILAYCVEARSLSEIAAKLGLKHKQSLRESYINPMLGKSLTMTHPENPLHMHQRYVTLQKATFSE